MTTTCSGAWGKRLRARHLAPPPPPRPPTHTHSTHSPHNLPPSLLQLARSPRFGPYLGATAAALVYNYLLAYQPESHPIPPGSSQDAPGGVSSQAAAVEAKEATLEAVAVTGAAPAASANSDLAAWK